MFTSCSDLLDLYPEDYSLRPLNSGQVCRTLELYANGFYGILPGAQGPGADDESGLLRERETEDLDFQP